MIESAHGVHKLVKRARKRKLQRMWNIMANHSAHVALVERELNSRTFRVRLGDVARRVKRWSEK